MRAPCGALGETIASFLLDQMEVTAPAPQLLLVLDLGGANLFVTHLPRVSQNRCAKRGERGGPRADVR